MSKLSFNREDAENFFKFLAHEKFTEIRIISPTEGIKGDFFVDNLADFLRICEKHNGQANVYGEKSGCSVCLKYARSMLNGDS